MSEIMTDEEQILWFLQEFENAEDYQLEDCELEIYGEDEQGREGTCTISVQAVCQKASIIIKQLLAERDALVVNNDGLNKANSKLSQLKNQQGRINQLEAALECLQFAAHLNAGVCHNLDRVLTDTLAIHNNTQDEMPSQCLAEIKAEAGRAGYLQGVYDFQEADSNHVNFFNDIEADKYAAKIRNTGTWLKDSNVNGGKRQGGVSDEHSQA